MNREIKFRVFDKIRNTMDFVSLEELLFHDGYYYSSSGESINDYEVMQYIGLKDKNGKEIYEGDIVKISYNNRIFDETEIANVIYKDCGFKLKTKKKAHFPTVKSFSTKTKLIEIIGNIYENPELL